MQTQLDEFGKVHATEIEKAVTLAIAREKIHHGRQGLDAPAVDESLLPDWRVTPLWIAGIVVTAAVSAWLGWQVRAVL